MPYLEQIEDGQTWPVGFNQDGIPYGFNGPMTMEEMEQECIKFDNEHKNKEK